MAMDLRRTIILCQNERKSIRKEGRWGEQVYEGGAGWFDISVVIAGKLCGRERI
jgi:hypothetical protein